MHTVIIGSLDDVRVNLFQEALSEQNYPAADVISYPDIIKEKIHLKQFVREGSIVRIESSGKSLEANHALLCLGANQADEIGNYARISQDSLAELLEDKGRIIAPRQWYLGLRAFLRLVQEQLAECSPHHLMNHPDDIILMFDKCLCHDYLQSHQVSVPRTLPTSHSFDELEAQMKKYRMHRVFLKLAHGSSASGVLAYQTNGLQHRAIAAIEMLHEENHVKLYNTRRIKTYNNSAEIANLVDALCQHRVHVEQWIPKASMENKAFDLRVLVIDGKAAHTIARLSNHPMTNLHLLNERRHRDKVIEHLGKNIFDEIMATCEHAMNCFPKSLYAGLDVVVASGQKQHYIIEMNAFGDLLKDTFYKGKTPYSLEIQRMAQYEHA